MKSLSFAIIAAGPKPAKVPVSIPLEAIVTAKRDKAAALKLLKRLVRKYGSPLNVVTHGLRAYSAAMNEIGAAAPALPTTPAGNAALSKHEDAAEVQLSSRPGLQ